MIRRTVTVALLLGSLAMAHVSAQEQDKQAPSNLPVSMNRIREALKKPPPLRVTPETRADFSVEINQEQRFKDLLDLIDFGSGAAIPGGLYGYQQQQILGQQTQPLFNVNVSGIGQGIGTAISKARRERAEQLARDEVQRALVDFCATHECPAR
jgi:hypothetical protein